LLGFRDPEIKDIKDIKTIKTAGLICRGPSQLDFSQDGPLIRLGFLPRKIKWRERNQVE
jgi:hypothetical protein